MLLKSVCAISIYSSNHKCHASNYGTWYISVLENYSSTTVQMSKEACYSIWFAQFEMVNTSSSRLCHSSITTLSIHWIWKYLIFEFSYARLKDLCFFCKQFDRKGDFGNNRLRLEENIEDAMDVWLVYCPPSDVGTIYEFLQFSLSRFSCCSVLKFLFVSLWEGE